MRLSPDRVQEVASTLGLKLTGDKAARLVAFESMLRTRGVPMGLVSEGDAGRLWERHILDCLRACAVVGFGDRDAYDLGSGAGLPGLVVAVVRPSLEICLVESQRKRVAFLELVKIELGLSKTTVRHERVERLRDPVDLCFARAVAPLPRMMELSWPVLRPGGRLVYFAGPAFQPQSEPRESRSVLVLRTPVLESPGPLVIMAR